MTNPIILFHKISIFKVFRPANSKNRFRPGTICNASNRLIGVERLVNYSRPTPVIYTINHHLLLHIEQFMSGSRAAHKPQTSKTGFRLKLASYICRLPPIFLTQIKVA
jgi:hypothetical protein